MVKAFKTLHRPHEWDIKEPTNMMKWSTTKSGNQKGVVNVFFTQVKK